MRIARLTIENYRGIKKADIFLPKHGVLIGDNNTGKTNHRNCDEISIPGPSTPLMSRISFLIACG